MDAAPVKKGKPNWTADECLYLSRPVDENKGILCAKFGAGVTTMKKREVWRKIADAINSTCSTHRTVEEIEKKWHNVHMKGKAELADARRDVIKTGGGPAGKTITPLAEAVESVIGANNTSICGIPGTVDTTLLMLEGMKSSAESTVSPSSQMDATTGLIAQDLQILNASECGDGHQQINLTTLPPASMSTKSTATVSVDLQSKKLELEIENLTQLLKLLIQGFEQESISDE